MNNELRQFEAKQDNYLDTSNYHGAKGVYEPINVMDYMAKEYVKRGIPADKAMELCLALKYLMRLGTKDYVKKELFKAENFIHRARTDFWLNGEKPKIGERFKEAPTPKQLDEDINGDR